MTWIKPDGYYKDNINPYQTPEYRRNKKLVELRDKGICVRCWTLHKVIRFDVQCDHLRHIRGGEEADNSLKNLWLLCSDCHKEKGINERNGRKGFNPLKDEMGWTIREPNWFSILASGETIRFSSDTEL